MKLWKTPIRILLLYLSALSLWASYNWEGFKLTFWFTQALHFLLIFGTGWIIYRVLLHFKKVLPTRWEHRAITCLILFLLFDPMMPMWVFLALGIVTELIQRIVRFPTGPLINPAALGVLVLSALGQFPSWWGVNFGPRLEIIPGGISAVMLLTVPLAGYVAYKYKKLPIIGAAAVGFALTYLLMFKESPISIVFEGTFAFFLLVMAVEPKTSPAVPKLQWIFGAAVGVLVSVLIGVSMNSYFVDPYSTALIICNIVFNLYRNQRLWLMRMRQISGSSPQATTV